MRLRISADWTVRTLLPMLAAGVAVALLATATAGAGEPLSSVTRGGRLYDNWLTETRERAPEAIHPAYPADRAGAVDTADSWRCQACHGWDYKGGDGADGKRRRSPGMKGIRQSVGAAPETVVAILNDANHRYGELMGTADLNDLAAFVGRGQVDMSPHIDDATGRALGDPSARADFYNSICAGCHGRDGRALQTMPPLGDAARANPWESLHKMLNGHPDERMPALRVLGPAVLGDILAYIQALPDGEMASSIVRGGRLYDNWRKELDFGPPSGSRFGSPAATRHPGYPVDRAYARDSAANWRCKECHGWDYQGRDGAYGKGRHFTGIKGIRAFAGVGRAAVIAVLKDRTHGYDAVLSERDLNDLANFVSAGQIDMNRFIEPKTGRAKANKLRYADYFTTICAACHGDDGTEVITSLPLGAMARQDPWETLHKIANGHPAEAMPALRVVGFDVLVGILAYIQRLPETR